MKRLALSFGLLLVLTLAACGKKAAPAQPAQPTGDGSATAEPAQPEPAPEAPTDQPAAGGGW